MSADAARARRVTELRDGTADYGDAFEIEIASPTTDSQDAEQWARAIFEESRAPVRLLLVVGWRLVLRLRLGPRPSPDHVLGWLIEAREPDEVRLRLDSPLMTALLTVRVQCGADRSRVAFDTRVTYRRRPARTLWAAVGLVHRRVVPHLLNAAARRN